MVPLSFEGKNPTILQKNGFVMKIPPDWFWYIKRSSWANTYSVNRNWCTNPSCLHSSKLDTKCTLVYGAKAEQKQMHMNDFIFLNETQSQWIEMCSIETQR